MVESRYNWVLILLVIYYLARRKLHVLPKPSSLGVQLRDVFGALAGLDPLILANSSLRLVVVLNIAL